MTSTSSGSSGSEERAFAARMSMLPETRAFVEGFAHRHGLADSDVLRLQLVIEELFTNTVQHGYGRECDEPIEIALRADGGRATLVYQDAARPYDPLAMLKQSQPALTWPVEQRPIGQLGVQLVAGLVERAQYRREGDRNRLELLLEPAG